jgi:hypothetical protein
VSPSRWSAKRWKGYRPLLALPLMLPDVLLATLDHSAASRLIDAACCLAGVQHAAAHEQGHASGAMMVMPHQ